MSSKPWTVAIAAAISLGCQSLADVQPAELEGDWVASEARFVEIAAPKRNNIDIIDLGFEVEMDLDAGGNFVLKLFEPDDTFDSVDGSLVIDGTKLEITTENGTGDGEVFLEDDQVAFRLTAGLEFDFGDGRGDVPARLLLMMDRTN